ncbi:MAG: hypothetical protein M1826_005248 [Phylliscum demangeonii]|nr:MAG: hypothetical protein M1826_005248 [Phylliscum demangeonii]
MCVAGEVRYGCGHIHDEATILCRTAKRDGRNVPCTGPRQKIEPGSVTRSGDCPPCVLYQLMLVQNLERSGGAGAAGALFTRWRQ